jgi:uncharacterized protein
MSLELIGWLAMLLVGVTVGMMGAGGSVLSVPILVYLFAIAPTRAAGYSLLIVGLTAALVAFAHVAQGNVRLKVAVLFALVSSPIVFALRLWLIPALPDVLFHIGQYEVTKDLAVLVLFALVMGMAGTRMLIGPGSGVTPEVNTSRLILVATVVGLVAGAVGAGGGFLIVPALLLYAGLPMKHAVGTSLVIIAIQSGFGFLGEASAAGGTPWQFVGLLALVSIAGAGIGFGLSRWTNPKQLRVAFGWMVIIAGLAILSRELTQLS